MFLTIIFGWFATSPAFETTGLLSPQCCGVETVYSFGKPNFFEFVKQEHLACRGDVALFDLSPFVKIEIEVSS